MKNLTCGEELLATQKENKLLKQQLQIYLKVELNWEKLMAAFTLGMNSMSKIRPKHLESMVYLKVNLKTV